MKSTLVALAASAALLAAAPALSSAAQSNGQLTGSRIDELCAQAPSHSFEATFALPNGQTATGTVDCQELAMSVASSAGGDTEVGEGPTDADSSHED